MFVVAPQLGEGGLWRHRRRPARAGRLAAEGWQFLAENRDWDADDRELIARATGLAAITPTGWLHESDKWFKAFARAYCASRNLSQALRECVEMGVEETND